MAEESNIQVVVRLRPMSERELKGNTLPVVTASTEKKEICVIKGAGARTLRNTFAFDNVFTSFSTQREVFEQTLAPVIGDVLSGYESTVFAYGQTGTGKTHTMEGVITDAELRGVIPRAAFDVFRRLSDDSYVEHAVSASFLEIYNEEMCDLLLDCDLDDVATVKARSKELRLVEDPSKKKGRGVFVMNLTEEPVNSPEDVLALMQRAAARRQVGETKMNKQSSRSHCVFTMNVSSKRRLPDGSTMECSGKLHMVDLAGSECAKSAGGSDLDPSRERERKNINQSLLTLGRVITLLKAGGKAKGERIPYRDSKLTRLLQESLGGRCKTCVIATVSPSVMSVDETLSTLQYAQSAHGIVNKPTASSMLKLNVDGAARPSTATGALNGQSQQDWAEMECRMHYLETQAEEAAAALARKHAELEGIIQRAERAEDRAKAAEDLAARLERDVVEVKRAAAEAAEKAEKAARALQGKLDDARRDISNRDAIIAARRATETKLTAEARALVAALDDASRRGAAAREELVAIAEAETRKRAASAAFGAASTEAVRGLGERTAAAASALKTAHEEARRAAADAASAAARGAESASAKLVEAADCAAAYAAESRAAAKHDASAAAARREKLVAKLEAASKAASDAAAKGAEDAARCVDDALERVRAGDCAVDAWAKETSTLLARAGEETDRLAREHETTVETETRRVVAAVSSAAEEMASQRDVVADLAAELAATLADVETHVAAVAAEETASLEGFATASFAFETDAAALVASKSAHVASKSALADAAAAADAQRAELEAVVVAHREGQSALVEGAVAQLKSILEQQSAALLANLETRLVSGMGATADESKRRAASAAENADAAATNASDAADAAEKAKTAVEAEGARASAALAALRTSATKTIDATKRASAATETAANHARRVSDAHATAIAASDTAKIACVAAGDALAASAKDVFAAHTNGVAEMVSGIAASRPAAESAAKDAATVARSLASDVSDTLAAVTAAVVKSAKAETNAANDADARAADAAAKANDALRAATDAADAAVSDAADDAARAAAERGDAAATNADAAAAKLSADAAAAFAAIGDDVAKHVREVDKAHEAVAPVPPYAPPAFSRELSATPPDDVVLAGETEENTAENTAMDTAMDADAAVGEETPAQMDDAHVAPPAAEATMDAENPSMATTAAAKPSMAEMRKKFSSKLAAPGATARSRALRDIN